MHLLRELDDLSDGSPVREGVEAAVHVRQGQARGDQLLDGQAAIPPEPLVVGDVACRDSRAEVASDDLAGFRHQAERGDARHGVGRRETDADGPSSGRRDAHSLFECPRSTRTLDDDVGPECLGISLIRCESSRCAELARESDTLPAWESIPTTVASAIDAATSTAAIPTPRVPRWRRSDRRSADPS